MKKTVLVTAIIATFSISGYFYVSDNSINAGLAADNFNVSNDDGIETKKEKNTETHSELTNKVAMLTESNQNLSTKLASLEEKIESIVVYANNQEVIAGERLQSKRELPTISIENTSLSEEEKFQLQEEEMVTQMAQQVQILDDVIASEDFDQAWSSNASAELNNAFLADDLSSIQVNSIDCKSTLCKLELQIQDHENQDLSFRKITSIDWPGAGFVYLDDDTGNVTLYLAKEGSEIPQL